MTNCITPTRLPPHTAVERLCLNGESDTTIGAVVDRLHRQGGRQIADTARVLHPKGTQRGPARSQILFVFCIQKGGNRPGDGRAGGRPAARPTEEKMGGPTPCQKHYRLNTPERPLEQLFLRSYTGDHGRPSGAAPAVGRPHHRAAKVDDSFTF